MTPSNDTPATTDTVVRRLTLGATLATVALTGVAFWLSYEHLHDVAQHYGLDGARAWAWPATVDTFIAIGEALILRAAITRVSDKAAVFLAVMGSVGSIALNVAGVGSRAAAMTYIVAAVPPVAALLAFGALMRQVHRAFANQDEPQVRPEREPADANQTAAKEEVREPAPTEVQAEVRREVQEQVREGVHPQVQAEVHQVQDPAEPPANTSRTSEPRTPANPKPAPRRSSPGPAAAKQPATNPDTPSPVEQVRQVLDLIETHGYDKVKLPFLMEQTGWKKTAAYNRLVEARAAWEQQQEDQGGD